MKRSAILTCWLVFMFSCTVFAATISRTAEDQLKQLEQRVAKTSESNVNEYSKEGLEAAKLTLGAAKVSAAAGKENETLLKIELAEAQLNAAEAKAAEKELLEKVALHRSEIKKIEAQLERYRQGETN